MTSCACCTGRLRSGLAPALAAGPGVPGDDPSFAVDGRALMRALRHVVPGWSPATERAWLMAGTCSPRRSPSIACRRSARADAGRVTSGGQTIGSLAPPPMRIEA